MSTGVFAFRMLVCQFRRELMFDDVFDFWERLWAAERLADCQLKVCPTAEIICGVTQESLVISHTLPGTCWCKCCNMRMML